jgi:predicted O-linked N-acetylglucosamine transferase (SPINDLY family)/predicted SAM-dependent methyltransferase
MSWLKHLRELASPAARSEPEQDDPLERLRAEARANPGNAHAQFALGAALHDAKRAVEAVEAFRAAVASDPDNASIHNALGAALAAAGRHEEALSVLEAALRLSPDMADIHFNLAGVYHTLGRLDDAIEYSFRARDMAPEDPYMHSNLLLILNYSEKHTPAQIFEEHKRFGDRFIQPAAAPLPDPAWPRRLRIGYVSPDFRNHAVSTAVMPVIEKLDRGRFEVFCYYTFPIPDAVTARYRELADGWADCASLSDGEFAQRIRSDRIDILVDLAGHTAGNRLTVFALRPAPVQVNAQGYPNTTGLRAFDYRITDAKADPPGEADRTHVERLVRLPRTFMCYRPGPGFETLVPPPAQSAGFVTFGCFNNFQKLTDGFFDTALRVLLQVPRSRLFLKGRQLAFREVSERVRERFVAAGIESERIVLRGWEPTPEKHLAAYEAVDIALDTFPYNGTTTTCEALWMGVPVVCLLGERHAARVGLSLLESVGLPELVARDRDEYVQTCARLAADLPGLAEMRRSLRGRMRAAPFMDEAGFVRQLEAAYLEMWQARPAAAKPIEHGAQVISQLVAQARSLRTRGDLQEARAACARVLEIDSAHGEALALLWDLCHELADDASAIPWLGRALDSNPRSAQTHYMLGCCLQDLRRDDEAIASFRRAIDLDPAHAKAANNLGCLLEARGDLEQAAVSYDAAVRAQPDLANAFYNRGNLRKQQGRFGDAEADFRRAVALQPGTADWHSNLGEALLMQWKVEEALACQRAALAIDPDNTKAHFGLGNALQSLGRPDQAEQAFRAALGLASADAHDNLLLCLHYRHGDEPELMLKEHLAWAEKHAAAAPRMDVRPDIDRSPGRRLRIGYLSPDFRHHAVAWAIEPMLAAHDHGDFHIFFYSNVAQPDATTQRFRGLCDEWRDVHRMSLDQVARQIRADRIDVLVDLAGHTAGGRPLVLARKPAPLQVSWQGYPNTTGLAAVDYRITDAWADPEGMTEAHYTEKLLRMPSGFFCYGPPPDAPDPAPLLADVPGRVTFGCFNNLPKVTPEIIGLWSRLLQALPEARMVMKAPSLDQESARSHVRDLFAAHGVDPSRVHLLEPTETHAQHLACYGQIDIALDPFPYHGTATTCEALWMGVPVISLAGRTHVARVGVSILSRVGLDELIAHTHDEYLEKAMALARDLPRLRRLHAELRDRMRGSPLLDASALARSVETAYRDIWRSWCSAAPYAPTAPARRGEALRLHIGGQDRKDGWKILNIQPGPHVDFVGDCTDLSRFADGSVDEIYASHVLEHLSYQGELGKALAEFYRVLRPGGAAKISVPDFERLCRVFLDPRVSAQGRLEVMRKIFGGQTDAFDFHKVGLTDEFMNHFLFRAGFSRVERVRKFALFQDASAQEVLGEPVSLNLVAYK